MLVTLIRTLIIFTTLFVVIRLMGKRQIGEMQPFEFIITLIIADLACIPMSDVSIPLVYGVVAILGLFLLHQLISIIEQGGNFCKLVISGKPSIVLNKNGVDLKELKKNNMGVEDLIESMRSMGYFSLDDLDYAIFESNGKLSALEKQKRDYPPAIPYLIVSDGKIKKDNLQKVGLTVQTLNEFLATRQDSLKNIEVMTADENGRIYLKVKNKKYEISKLTLEGAK